MQPNLFARTTKLVNPSGERFGANEDEPDRVQHFTGGSAVMRFVEVNQHVRAMERNHRRLRPLTDQREEMDSDLAKVNVKKLGLVPCQGVLDSGGLALGHLPGGFAQISKPEA